MTLRWIVLLLLALAACTNGDASSARAQIAGPSIYPLAVTLHDARDQTLGLDAFRGHPVVISMFFGSCPVACPMIVSNIKRIEGDLPADARADLRVLLVSFDPAHDTPAVLAKLAASRGLDTGRWTLATGSDDDVRQIAAVLGVSYRALPGGGFAHDSVLTVLDRQGGVVARTDEPSPDLSPLRAAILKSR